jgi:hypothetical protein
VDHFILIDNCDVCPENESRDYLADYIEKGQVTLHRDLGKHAQTGHYTKYSKPFRALAEWIIAVDMDEFVYARRGYKLIGDYLMSLSPAVVQVCVATVEDLWLFRANQNTEICGGHVHCAAQGLLTYMQTARIKQSQ